MPQNPAAEWLGERIKRAILSHMTQPFHVYIMLTVHPEGLLDDLGGEYDISRKDTTQAQFSSFYYGKYRLGISSKSSGAIGFNLYKQKRIDSFNFNIETAKHKEELDLDLIDKPTTMDAEFKRKHQYIIKDYINAFVNYDYRGYTVYINSEGRLYHFWSMNSKDTGNKSQTARSAVTLF